MAAEAWAYPGSTLVRIIDGDSFVARVARTMDFGFHVIAEQSAVQKFRLNRIACAPLSTPSGQLARSVAESLFRLGPFHLTSVRPYKFGDEWMAEVVTATGVNVSDLLVEYQYAAPWDGRGPQPAPPWPRTVE